MIFNLLAGEGQGRVGLADPLTIFLKVHFIFSPEKCMYAHMKLSDQFQGAPGPPKPVQESLQ